MCADLAPNFLQQSATRQIIDASGAGRQRLSLLALSINRLLTSATMTVHARHTSSHALNTLAHLRYGCCQNGVARTYHERSVWLGARPLSMYHNLNTDDTLD
jgi:hypothetical protein